jgi:hypothetical protein
MHGGRKASADCLLAFVIDGGGGGNQVPFETLHHVASRIAPAGADFRAPGKRHDTG